MDATVHPWNAETQAKFKLDEADIYKLEHDSIVWQSYTAFSLEDEENGE